MTLFYFLELKMTNKPQRKIDEQELRRLGFSEAAIKEARAREQRGLLDIELSPDLVDRTIAQCNQIFEEQQHRTKMETSFLYRTVHTICDYVKSFYR